MSKPITYSQTGDNYETKDPIKKLAQKSAEKTAGNIIDLEFKEIADSRGESAYVWKQGKIFMASVIEGLGTKNLIADQVRKYTNKTHYDAIAHDTVATIINDLVTVGARPLTIHAYWAIENNSWLEDKERMKDLIKGWKNACDISQASWGGGETPTLKGIITPNTCELGGSAVGIIKTKKRLLVDKNLKENDQIILIKSNGINANGISLARAISERLSEGYKTKINKHSTYGEALLKKTNIYSKLIQEIFQSNVDLHYIVNITGHGLRKIMRAKGNYSYFIENIFMPDDLFLFMQKNANISDEEAYGTWNMGQDYALFLPKKNVEEALKIIKRNGFVGLHAGYIKKGERKVNIIKKNITYLSKSLDLR